MQKVAIIGGGLAGTLLAMQCIRQAQQSLHIELFDQAAQFQTGIAYADSGFPHLLNVAAGKMSAWPEQPMHFVDWLQQQPAYAEINAQILAQSYLPRALFGQYLQHQWQQSLVEAASKQIEVQLSAVAITHIQVLPEAIELTSAQGLQQYQTAVVATGNELPRHPLPTESGITKLPGYQHNPWQMPSVNRLPADTFQHDTFNHQIANHQIANQHIANQHVTHGKGGSATELHQHSRVLILGNGLTMVDTVLALRQSGLRQPIMSLSPHGYGMLPHRQAQITLPDFASLLDTNPSLRQVLQLFNQQRKRWRQLGLSAEGLVDSLRPYSQKLWHGFSAKEKQFFFKKLRHMWGVARHRLPMQIHDQIQQLRLQGALEVKAGTLLHCQPCEQGIDIWIRIKGNPEPEQLQVDRIINCTGPEHCFSNLPSHFLASAIANGTLAAGPLNLGLAACPQTLALKNAAGERHQQLYGMGSVLRGELWETTALNEIRQQAQQLAAQILS